jgi:hypothetical protein
MPCSTNKLLASGRWSGVILLSKISTDRDIMLLDSRSWGMAGMAGHFRLGDHEGGHEVHDR